MKVEAGSTGRAAQRHTVTSRDVEILKWITRCRFATTEQVQVRFGLKRSKAFQRLGVLATEGLVKRENVLHRQPGAHRVTRKGLAMLGTDMPVPTIGLQSFLHDQAVVWEQVNLELSGCETITEREMRYSERALGEAYTVRIPPSQSAGAVTHLPDLAFRMKGLWYAVEVELAPKSEARLSSILLGYLAEPRYDTVVYCVPTQQLITRVTAIGAKLGLGDHLKVVVVRQPAAA